MTTLAAIRRDSEATIARELAKLDDEHKAKLRAALRKYGRVQDIPPGVWDEIRGNTEKALALLLIVAMTDADTWMTQEIERQGVAAEPVSGKSVADLSKAAAGYALTAQGRASRTALLTTETLRDRLARKIEDRRLSTRGGVGELDAFDIDQALDEVLTPERRQGMATDGTTGAISDGQRGAAGRYAPGDLRDTAIDLVWRTEDDDRVCSRCSPLEGTTEDVWGKVFPDGPGPEAHPSCRCELFPRVRALEADERV